MTWVLGLVITVMCFFKCLDSFPHTKLDHIYVSKLMARKVHAAAAGRKLTKLSPSGTIATSRTKRSYFEQKVIDGSKSDLSLFNIILELRDKDCIEYFDLALQATVGLSRFKGDTNLLLLKAINVILHWAQNHQVIPDKVIFYQVLKNAYCNIRSISFLESLTETLRAENIIAEGEQALLVPNMLYHLQQEAWSQSDVESLKKTFTCILGNITGVPIDDLNDILRVLSRVGLRQYAVELFRQMTASNRVNTFSQEFFMGAFVTRVLSEYNGATMKELQKARSGIPEILLLGKSNVGKSSLVNILLNRKNIAKVSPIPGCTQLLHLYSVEVRGERELQPYDGNKAVDVGLTIVDAPGMGFAETVDKNRQQSWRSLIMRYLAKRDQCSLVLHLVDSRHELSQTDYEIQDMLKEAVLEREKSSIRPFEVLRVFTKVDKSEFSEEHHTHLNDQLDSYVAPLSSKSKLVRISSHMKTGFEDLWKCILNTIQHATYCTT